MLHLWGSAHASILYYMAAFVTNGLPNDAAPPLPLLCFKML